MYMTQSESSQEYPMVIINQARDAVIRVDDIQLKNSKITGISTQHPMGVTLGKYRDKGRAEAVFLGLIQELKSGNRLLPVLELPVE